MNFMKSLNNFLKIFLTLILINGTGQAQAEPMSKSRELSFKIDRFVAKILKSGNIYLMAEDDVVKLLDGKSIDAFLQAQTARVSDITDGPDDSLKKFDWSEQNAVIEREAQALVKEMFTQPIEEINLSALEILHRFLFDDNAQQPMLLIIKEIVRYRFSADELYRMEKEGAALHQYTTGSAAALLLLSGIALWKGHKVASPKIWTTLKESLPKLWEPAVRETPEVVTAVTARTAAEGEISVDQLMAMLERSGLAQAAPKVAGRSAPLGNAISKLGKMRFYAHMPSLLIDQGLAGLTLLTGVSAMGGATNIGLHAIAKVAFPESFSNTVIDFSGLKDDYYDPLTALRLTCQSHDFVERVHATKTGSVLPLVLELNRIYTEFELLGRMNPTLIDVNPLPPDVTAENGKVHFSRLLKGHSVSETFDCAKLNGNIPRPLTVSLNQALTDIMATVPTINALLAASKTSEPTPPAPLPAIPPAATP